MDAIHVVGAGGIGCAVGYALRAAGVPVLFVDTNPAKVEAGGRGGVRVNDHPPLPAAFTHFDDWHPPPAALVVLCTKCYDNAPVLAKLAPGTHLLPIQNGFDPQLDAFGHAVEAIASFVSECAKDRPHTRITRRGELHIGYRSAGGGRGSPASADGRQQTKARVQFAPEGVSVDPADPCPPLARAVRSAGLFRVVAGGAIAPIKHTKLMYNAAISPLAAAAGIDNGELLSLPQARARFFALLEENHAILQAAGIELGKVGPFHPRRVAWILRRKWLAGLMAKFFEPSLRGTYCSMAGEIQKGRTEIDNYNGHLIRLAERVGVACPQNRAVHDLVVRMTAARARPHRDMLSELEGTPPRVGAVIS